MKSTNIIAVFSSLAVFSTLSGAEILDHSEGFKIGRRLTLRPRVSFAYTFDNNVDTSRSGEETSYFSVNPGLNADFKGDRWRLSGDVYYNYRAITSGYSEQLNNSTYGERLGFTWSNIDNGGPGWSLALSESYVRVDQNDDMSDGGRGIWRDRQNFDSTFVVQRRFNQYLHASVNGGYYWLDYANDSDSYASLYGWSRWTAGVEIGCTLSRWSDLFIAGSYQGYEQDSGSQISNIGNTSDGYTIHAGIGSYMTERISYRVSGGVSTFNYGDASTANGFTYQGTLNWKIGETWQTKLLFSSYYHPSEREYGQAVRCDSVSWGLSKSMVRNKLNLTFDVAYRSDTRDYSTGTSSSWDLNLLSARLGVDYRINRIISMFANGEYQKEMNEGDNVQRHYDYDRLRFTVGAKFSY